ncbi:cytochrome b5 [Stipitochalara longipes BDJ]|nr:cytochrome b5 [Stipitochalara longipes BDJ]
MSGLFDSFRDNFHSSAKKVELPIYTEEEAARHNTPEDIWIIVNGNVYNFSEFQYVHPGGRHWMVDYAGRDATRVFQGAHKRDEPKPKHMIGRLAPKESEAEVEGEKKGSFIKKLFKWGKKGEGKGAQDDSKYKEIGFATPWQGPNQATRKGEPDKGVAGTSTLRLVNVEEEKLTKKA